MTARRTTLALCAMLALASVAGPASALAAAPPDAGKLGAESCFYVNQIESNRPLGDRAVVLRTDGGRYYRLDFAARCAMLETPDPKLIIRPFGSELVCHAIDLDISVSDQGPGAIAEPCIPGELRPLSPAEVAALPKGSVP